MDLSVGIEGPGVVVSVMQAVNGSMHGRPVDEPMHNVEVKLSEKRDQHHHCHKPNRVP
jgi:hypothetical protein